MPKDAMDRRAMLKLGLGATAGTVVGAIATPGGSLAGATVAACAGETPAQETGPFYPEGGQPDKDADLTMIKGHTQRAEGDVMRVRGRVVDEACAPVSGAVVEIWHASAKGRYAHERDPNPTPRDPHFQGRAELVTDSVGRFSFTTVKPGAYPLEFLDGRPREEAGWRTPHIHMRLARRGFHELVTQMYFPGEPLNAKDLVMNAMPEADRARCIATRLESEEVPSFAFEVAMKRIEARSLVSRDVLDAIAGDYEFDDGDFAKRTLRIIREGTVAFATVAPVVPKVELRSMGGLRFDGAPLLTGAVLEFERSGTGKATGVLMRGPGAQVRRGVRSP